MSSTAALPAERVAELRQAIHCQVTKMGIKEQIQRCLADSRNQSMNEESVLQLLESRGIVESVMQSLQLKAGGRERRREKAERLRVNGEDVNGDQGEKREEGECAGEEVRLGKMVAEEVSDRLDQRTGEEVPKRGLLCPNRRYLFLRVDGGRAFLDHLQHSQTPCLSRLSLHICFRGQRVHSRPVPCACEPDFSEDFLLELVDGREGRGRGGGGGGGRVMSYSDALAISEPIRLVVTRHNERGERDLVGTFDLDWRCVLTEERGRWSGAAELSGVGSESKISSGLLELKLDVFPKSPSLERVFLSGHRETERQQTSERERLFLVYSRQWWQEYLQIRPEHGRRMVKIFAMDESGINRSVCSFVWPLRAGRLLDGPRQGARFVSLVPCERGGGQVGVRGRGGGDVWSSLHTILCQMKGDVEDHCCLLCSLLLGYGLEAYVCLGTKTSGHAHSWVVTIGNEGGVTFWESLTGQRYRHVPFDPNTQAGAPPISPAHPYHTVDCLFNHTSFLANSQPSASVLTCSFDLGNRSVWKRMSREALLSTAPRRRDQVVWSLMPPSLDPVTAANVMEQDMRTLVSQHRTDLGLSTVWDDTLCYLLTPALASYEQERCGGGGGGSEGTEEFQEAVRSHVEEGHTFKGFPIQLTHCNPRRAFLTCLRSPVCSEIVGCRGDQVRLALRVKVYPYPEEVVAVWIMIATTYCCVLCL